MHLLLYATHQCALSNKCLLKLCGNKHFLQCKLNFHLNSLLQRLLGIYFHKAGIVSCHSNSSARYNKVKFDTTAVAQGRLFRDLTHWLRHPNLHGIKPRSAACGTSQESPSFFPRHTLDYMNRPDNTALNFRHDKLTADIPPLIKRNHIMSSTSASCCHLHWLQLCQANISHPASLYNKQIYLA